MVGRDTSRMPVTGRPANCGLPLVPVTACSGPGTDWASGGVPGQIGICVCPADGCQTTFFACSPAHTNSRHGNRIHCFMTFLCLGARPRLVRANGALILDRKSVV